MTRPSGGGTGKRGTGKRGTGKRGTGKRGTGSQGSDQRGGVSRRALKVRVASAKGRTSGQTRWLQRQLNDPYVAEAQAKGYRARSAFKLLQLDAQFGLLGPGRRVVDLGAAPGGWCQVAAERVDPSGCVVGIDLQAIEPIPGVVLLEGDAYDPATLDRLRAALGGPADLVLSDMAAPATGHAATDHLRTMGLAEAAAELASGLLAPGGGFLVKVLRGGADRDLLAQLKRDFAHVRHVKPPASRSESRELYLIALEFRARHEPPA